MKNFEQILGIERLNQLSSWFWIATNTVESGKNAAINSRSFIDWLITNYPADAKIIENCRREEIRLNAELLEDDE